MEFFHKQTHIDFMGIRKITAVVSILISVIAIAFLMVKGLNFGLDFTGGTQLEVRFEKSHTLDSIRKDLSDSGFSDAKVSLYGATEDILIRLANRKGVSEAELGAQVLSALQKMGDKVELRRIEFVGSEVGEHLAEQGILAVFIALLATMIYIAMRFEFRFAISAAVGLLHDPIVILGIFAACQIEFDLAALAAILAVIGYSLNDTIVVYDRVRENFRKIRKGSTTEIMNLSINQTLSRTIMTSLVTLLVVVALFIFGGESLHGFSTALIIGIIVGTYSSIYIAGALALAMGLSRHHLVPQSRKSLDEMP